MKYFGAHVSACGRRRRTPRPTHAAIGATGFALFTKNQRQWVATPADATGDDRRISRRAAKRGGLYACADSARTTSYLINLGQSRAGTASPNPRAAFLDEMQRCELLGLDRLNFHPGSHLR